MRAGFNAGVTVPAFISIGNNGNFTLARAIEDIAGARIGTKAATLTFILVNHRRHINSVNRERWTVISDEQTIGTRSLAFTLEP